MIRNWIHIYQSQRAFTDREAWTLFRLAAWGEAVGWLLLIVGIAVESVWHTHAGVALAGRIHGTLFITYIGASLAVAPSLRWPLWKTVLAGLCSVPPFGSVMFEQCEAWRRQFENLDSWWRIQLYHNMIK